MVLPSKIVKELKIDPSDTTFLLRPIDDNNLSIQILRLSELGKDQ